MILNKFSINIDYHKLFALIVNMLGLYLSFLYAESRYQTIVTKQYINEEIITTQKFRITSGLIMIQRLLIWLGGEIFTYLFVPKESKVQIPIKNTMMTSGLIYLSLVITIQSMYCLGYHFVVLTKSLSLIVVIIVGVFFTRIRSKNLKLQGHKIILALIVVVGVILFNILDSKANFKVKIHENLLGFSLVILGLFIDGFVSDFQAEIKENYNPHSLEMATKINKWMAIWGLIHILVTFQLPHFIEYFFRYGHFHDDVVHWTLGMGVGQIFIYRLIMSCKQHIVPFIFTLNIGLNTLYFSEKISKFQFFLLFIVLLATLCQFFLQTNTIQSLQSNAQNDVNQIQIYSQNEYNKIDSQSYTYDESFFYSDTDLQFQNQKD